MARVLLDGVTKRYGKTEVVSDVTLEIADGEFMVLVGPSGCGKTTILRMIAGLVNSDSGSIYIGGRRVNDVPPKDRDIAMVFQSYALYPHLTVFENMAFGLRFRKLDREEIRRRVLAVAEALGLSELLGRKPGQLSGGQRQRVALGRAIVRQPQAFLMDEPLSNLDAKLRVMTRGELTKLHARLGVTTIYVTHDQVEAMTLGQRIAVLSGGVIQQVGTPAELYNQPANMFVAGFIGSPSMNFFPIKLAVGGGFAEDGRVRIPFVPRSGAHLPALPGGTEIVVGVRPEDLAPAGPGEAANVVGQVEVTELLGSERLVYLRVGDRQAVVRLEAKVPVVPGDDMKLKISGTIHLFNKATGRAL